MKRIIYLAVSIMALGIMIGCISSKNVQDKTPKPNILVIMVDDLNDNIGTLGGHPQSETPNIDKFSQSATSFVQAYTNAPMCGPSRASMFTGVYPHHSNNYFQAPWFQNEVLKNTRTMMEQFKKAGYRVMGTGKIMHQNKTELWSDFENPADYTPTPFDGEKRVPHPNVPAPFSSIGWVDGSLGPLINLEGKTTSNGKPLKWVTGNPEIGYRPMRYINDNDRDFTPDERNAKWTAETIQELDEKGSNQPFFLAVGFVRPHTPLIAPKKYFDLFPLDDLELSVIKKDDKEDTYLKTAYKGDVFTLKLGTEMFNAISEAYGSTELGLKKWTQAYLACVAAVDDNIGQVLDALEKSSFNKNTIVVLASDHGFHMGEKDYLYKNSLWEESNRVPLIIRVPGVTKDGTKVKEIVSLIDIYPTLIDLSGISMKTAKNERGHSLDGNSMRQLLENPDVKEWNGSKPALTVVYAGPEYENDPTMQHYAIRTQRYRYILYNNGDEELYDHSKDPYEWYNLAQKQNSNKKELKKMRSLLEKMVRPYNLKGFANLE